MCLEGLLCASNGGKAQNVVDVCVCAFPLGIHRTTPNIQGKDGQDPGQDQLLQPFGNNVAICTKHGGVREVSSSGALPFSDFKRSCLA